MPYAPFSLYFPSTAASETPSVVNVEDDSFPFGEYTFTELFCDECDCRRAIINVIHEGKDSVASISYGWGSRSFYIRWFGKEEQDILDDMMGIHLHTWGQQSKNAARLLEIFLEMVEANPNYEKNLRRHYSKFRKRMRRMAS